MLLEFGYSGLPGTENSISDYSTITHDTKDGTEVKNVDNIGMHYE